MRFLCILMGLRLQLPEQPQRKAPKFYGLGNDCD
jgi:hypothetical protein